MNHESLGRESRRERRTVGIHHSFTNTSVHTRQWIEYRPTIQISSESPLEFLIPPQSVGYMDLRRSTLKMKVRLTNALGQPVAKDANVRMVNLPLQAVFSQVSNRLPLRRPEPITRAKPASTCYWRRVPTHRVLRDSQLFEKDKAGHHDDADLEK